MNRYNTKQEKVLKLLQTATTSLFGGDKLEEHNNNLKKLIQRILDSGLKIKVNKCKFVINKIIFSGHVLSTEGISPDPEQIKSISPLQVPTNITEIKPLLLGMTNFYNKFIPESWTITTPLQQQKKISHSTGDHNNKLPLTN